MERYYKFAGVEIALVSDNALFSLDERHLELFRVDCVEKPHAFYFEKVYCLDSPVGNLVVKEPNLLVFADKKNQCCYRGTANADWNCAYARVIHKGKEHRIQWIDRYKTERIPSKIMLEHLAAEHLIAQNNGFILHCSYIVHNGKAILFTAPSETGKSTQAELWKDFRGARIINGDRAAVRIVDGVPMAEGIPFAGSSQYCLNESHPIAAVVYLGQAKQTTIRPMRGREAFSRIWEGITLNVWDRDDVEKVSDCLMKLITSVPAYRLECTPDESAVKALEAML